MKLYSVLMFIFVFTIEVKLRAFDSNSEKKIIETPENCLEAQSGYCVIKNQNQKFSYEAVGFFASLAPEAIVTRQREKELSFVKGQLFLKTEAKVTIEVPYGQIEIDKNTTVLLDKFEDKVVVQTIFGKAFLKPLGEKKTILVIQGHENYLAKVSQLKAQTGIPKPILVEQLLKPWAYHANISKEKFIEQVNDFKEVHETAVRELSILNEEIASREIASAKAEKLAEEMRLKRVKEHKEMMQRSYYDRLLGE